MLAVATTDALVVLGQSVLKNPPSSVPPAATFLAQPTAIAWTTDNASLFLALPDSIERYDPSGKHLDTVYSFSDPVTALVAKDKGNTLLLSVGNEVLVFDVHARKIAHKLTSHRHDIIGLSLSSDASLLAAISCNAVHVYNLSLASHTILRGFPTGPINVCAFHPHTRTRLLLGIGHHFVIYDTSRTSGPVKTCTLEKGTGDIVAITSSPYSKTLVALACSSGNVCLVDLEKDPMYVALPPLPS
ncbi:hypothetical protein EIP86_002334 [Pleurotus ostreatoroseus]|nr:hypothetical protein EIP86_002334 [Pleurotus ostreatoroseus]